MSHKQPSFINELDYTGIANKLYPNAALDKWLVVNPNDEEEDIAIKKSIANITFGLLEKNQIMRTRKAIYLIL